MSDYATFSSTGTSGSLPHPPTSTSLLWYTIPTALARRPNLKDGLCVGLIVVAALCIALFATPEDPPPITVSLTRAPWSGSKRVLVTGFLPFADNEVNPSLLVAKRLNNTCDKGVCFEGLIVEVTPNGVARAASYINEHDYDGVLMMGLENSAKGLKLEVVAQNIEQTATGHGWANDIPLNATPAIADGPRMLATTAPLERISLVRLKPTIKVNELWSNDAGSFACNELYYRALHGVRMGNQVSDGRQLTPTLFVHVPTLDVAKVQEVAEIVTNIARLMVR